MILIKSYFKNKLSVKLMTYFPEKPSTSTAINHVAKASPVKSNGETSAGPAGILNQMEPIKKPRKYKKDKKGKI